MSDYLRARVDALQQEVTRLNSKVAVLEAKLEVSQYNQLNEKLQEL
jgi:outer membrane murein-binding lipoprotein Lpp